MYVAKRKDLNNVIKSIRNLKKIFILLKSLRCINIRKFKKKSEKNVIYAKSNI
jgi:hypothetical protein